MITQIQQFVNNKAEWITLLNNYYLWLWASVVVLIICESKSIKGK